MQGFCKPAFFQSELLISEEAFLEHFPSYNGFRYFVGEGFGGAEKEALITLESALSDFGLDVERTRDKLEDFQQVENTYLNVFQALGGLGLLLGTMGLGIVLFRNLLERQGELATMRAIGYPMGKLGLLLLIEKQRFNSMGFGYRCLYRYDCR